MPPRRKTCWATEKPPKCYVYNNELKGHEEDLRRHRDHRRRKSGAGFRTSPPSAVPHEARAVPPPERRSADPEDSERLGRSHEPLPAPEEMVQEPPAEDRRAGP